MKKLLHLSVSLILAFSILIGYTGVPVYKMICNEDGHVLVSLMDQQQNCKHNDNTKDCCQPLKKEASACCDYSSDFFQLHELTLIQESQNTAGHFLTATALFCYLQQNFSPSNHSLNIRNNTSPPLSKLKPKQTSQSLFRSFLI